VRQPWRGDIDGPALDVHVLAADAENFRAAHRGLETNDDKGIDLGVLILLRGFNEALNLLDGEIGDPNLYEVTVSSS